MARASTKMSHSYCDQKEELLARMKKVEGQARGVSRMIEEDRYCIDIVQQLTALASASEEVALMILQDHIKGCVTDAIREQRGDEAVSELIAAIRKAIRR